MASLSMSIWTSELVAELLELHGVGKSYTSPYHTMGNGTTEKFNSTLGNMLRSLPHDQNRNGLR